MDERADQVLAEAEQIVQDTFELEVLGELVRIHASVAKVLAALETRIQEVAGGAEV